MEDKIHSLSLSFLVDSLKKQFGGTGGNIAYSLRLLDQPAFVMACVGNDFDAYRSFFQKNHIPLTYVKEYKTLPSSSYFVVTDKANNQIGSFYIGAMKHAPKLSLHSVKEHIDFAVIAPTNPDAMKKAVLECSALEIPYLYDPAFQIPVFSRKELSEGIKNATILIGNDYEMSELESKLELTHEEIVAQVPIVVTTLGNKGSIIETRTDHMHIRPAKVKKAVDPTGAGDAYRAGFLAGYINGFPLDVCGKMGSVASAYTVELYGTQTHTYTKRAFIMRYEENYGETITL
jgi:adenosine kinase